MNIKLTYLYRDGANYKQYGEVVFSNTQKLSVLEVKDRIKRALIDETWFYADKWQLKNLHFANWDMELDHKWHEYDNIIETNEFDYQEDITDLLFRIEQELPPLAHLFYTPP